MFENAPVALPDDGMVVDKQDRNAWGLRRGHPGTIAFSSEVGTGSREENASNK